MTYLGPSLRRRPRRARPWLRAVGALAVSLLVNAVGLWLVQESGLVAAVKHGRPQAVALAPISPEAWERNRAVAGEPTPSRRPPPQPLRPAPPPPAPPPPDPMKGQVVDVQPSKDSTPPKDSKYLAEHDSTVEKETKSKHARAGYDNTLAKPGAPNAGQTLTIVEERARRERGGEEGRAGVAKPGAPRQAQRPPEPAPVSPQAPRDRLALKLDEQGTLALRDPRPGMRGQPGAPRPGTLSPEPDAPEGEVGPEASAGKEGPRRTLQLKPSAADYERIAGGPAPDRLDGVEEGEGTYLNTRQWKYAGFFNRVKDAVARSWDPNKALRARDPQGARFAAKDWITGVVVKLDAQGALKDIMVEKPSGLDFLDAEAMAAFHRAQPFMNPPPGLVDPRGEIVFPFLFAVEGSVGLQFLRGPYPPPN